MTQQLQQVAPNTRGFLPLFYKDPVLLRFDRHGESDRAHSAPVEFALEATAVPLGIGEFMPAIRHYPVVFSSAEPAIPLAVLGLQQGGKLLIDHHGARQAGHYQPGYVRRYPFTAAETPGQSARLVVNSVQDRLDDAHAMAPIEPAMELCQAFHEDHLKTAAFAESMDKAGLLIPYRCEMRFPDGSLYTVDGFRVIDETLFRALPGQIMADWHSEGWLDLIIIHLASQRNWQLLLDLHVLRNNRL